MELNDKKYNEYVKILREELVPAMGCTEPIALAYAAAKAREVLGVLPASCEVEVSGNIIKNAKSVVVPNTNGMRGIRAAVAAGLVAGDASKILEVLSSVKEEEKAKIEEFLETHTFPPDNKECMNFRRQNHDFSPQSVCKTLPDAAGRRIPCLGAVPHGSTQ